MADTGDAALESLWLPFASGALAWPQAGGALFLRARDGWPLHQHARPGLVCEQSFKPEADALQRSGFPLADAGDTTLFPLVLVLPPRQRDEARALMARAVARTAPGGRRARVHPECRRREIRRRRPGSAGRPVAGPVEEPLPRVLERAAVRRRRSGARRRMVDAGRAAPDRRWPFLSRPGVFAWDRIDPASALLAAHLPADFVRPWRRPRRGLGLSRHRSTGALSARDRARPVRGRGARARPGAQQPRAVRRARRTRAIHWHDVTTDCRAATTSSSAIHRSMRRPRRRPDIGRDSSPPPPRRSIRADGCGWSPTATCRTKRCSMRISAACARSRSSTDSRWSKR